uniref:Uncharacterized protein n=1 Tax=Glossina palpalis gambiensis TaxID=67801 RepID=A0A1B0BQF5_9MUSC
MVDCCTVKRNWWYSGGRQSKGGLQYTNGGDDKCCRIVIICALVAKFYTALNLALFHNFTKCLLLVIPSNYLCGDV